MSDPAIHIRVSQIPQLIRDLAGTSLPQDYQTQKPVIFSDEDFTQPFLDPEELLRLNRFKALKKQVEWLCGRFSAKAWAKERLMPGRALDKIRINYMEQGAPYLTAFPDHCLSLSHSGIYTAVALASAPGILTGIDIEAVGPRPDHHFMKTAFTPREIQAMGPSARDVFESWTLKEAYLKYIRMGFNESLHQVEIIQGNIFHHGEKQNLDCLSRELKKGYIISVVSPPNTMINLTNHDQKDSPRIAGS